MVPIVLGAAACGGPAAPAERNPVPAAVSPDDHLRARDLLTEADAAYESRQHHRAIPLYEEALAVRPLLSRAAYLRLSDCYELAGDPVGACSCLERGRETYHGEAAILKRLGSLYERRGKITFAIDCFREVLARAPGDREAIGAVVRLRREATTSIREEPTAVGPLVPASPPEPAAPAAPPTQEPAAPLGVLAALLAGGKANEADAHYRQTIGPSPEALDHLRAGMLFLEHRLPAQAAAALLRALELDPENPDVFGRLGDLRMEAGKPDEAVEWYRKGLRFAPDHEVLKEKLKAAYQKR